MDDPTNPAFSTRRPCLADGKIGIGIAPGAGVLTVSHVAQFGIAMGDSTVTKSCGTPGINWTNTPSSAVRATAGASRRDFLPVG